MIMKFIHIMYVYPCLRIIIEASSSVCHNNYRPLHAHAYIRTCHAIDLSTALIGDGIRLRVTNAH